MNLNKCFGIAGWKNSGKTSLVAALVTEISSRGYKVSTIKHAHHTFDLDKPNTDSFKHREAGAVEVMLVSRNRWAIQHELHNQDEPNFEDMIAKLAPCDLVLVEGYKKENISKLEIIGPENKLDLLWPQDDNIKAIASDVELDNCPLPHFNRNSIKAISDFILKSCGIEK